MDTTVTDWKAAKANYEANKKYIEIYQGGCAFMDNGDDGTWSDDTTVSAENSCLDQAADFVNLLLTGKADDASNL